MIYRSPSNVTLENLTFTGGFYGINASYNAGSTTNLTITGSTFYGSQVAGINLANNFSTTTVQTGDVITNNVFHDMLGANGSGGVESTGDDITLANNTAYNMSFGFEIANGANSTITGNIAHNDSVGIEATNCVVTDNIVSRQWQRHRRQRIGASPAAPPATTLAMGINFTGGTAGGNISYGNTTGIFFSGDATASDNLIYNNTGDGIEVRPTDR